MVKGILKKYEPLETDEITITIKCPADVNMHEVIDMRRQEVTIQLAQLAIPEPIPAPEIEELDNCIATIQKLKLSLYGGKKEEL